MPAAGIDISDYSIKFVSLETRSYGAELVAFGKIDLPPGTVENGDIKEPGILAEHLGKLVREHHISFAHLCLPEEHAYLFQMEVPPASEGELGQMLEFHLKENVPLGPEEAIFDYVVVERPATPPFVNVSVYPAQFIAQYVEVLSEAGITPLSLEIEGQATARALVGNDEGTHIIVDVGRSEASLTIVSYGIVTFTATLENGGDSFTQAIVKGLSVSYSEAERLKREVGFVNVKEYEKLYSVLLPAVHALVEAVGKHVTYNQMHTTGVVRTGPVSRLVLSGGNANMAGVAEYYESELDMPVTIGNVWRYVYAPNTVPPIPAAQSLEYATAVGLALRSVERCS